MTLELAWLVYGALDQPTGGYVYDRIILERLRARGLRIEVVSLRPHEASDLADVCDRLEALAPDVVVGDALCARELGPIFEVWAGRSRRILLVHHLASWELEITARDQAALTRLEKRTLHASDQVITTSFTSARRLQEQFPNYLPEVIVPGADRLRRSARRSIGTGIRLLGVGSAIPRKRWELLLDCLDPIAAQGVCLRLVGDQSRDPVYNALLERRIAGSDYLRTHVEQLGVVDSARLEREFAETDAVILPSSLEGYGMVISEALHAGVPVIAARGSAISEVLSDFPKAALLFEDASDLLHTLQRFFQDERLRRSLRTEAEDLTARLPTWADAEARFYALLTQSNCVRQRMSSASCASVESSCTISCAEQGSEKATRARTSR